jgi:enoyl-CoA hydratase/carnithine racemase
MTDGIERREDAGIIEIRLDRAEKKNALTGAMYGEMTAALRDASSRADIGCVLFTANGDAFCAGNDIKDFLSGGSASAMEFIHAIAAFDKPIVAAVNGLAVGIGTTMLLHCDLVYASPAARFTVPFVSLGLVPEAASSLLLPARTGWAKAAEMFLLGQSMDAEAADRAGLITTIVPADALDAHARKKAQALVAMPPEALAATRRLVKGDPATVEAAMAAEEEVFAKALVGPEAREAFAAFVEKRAPDFKRRVI